jgi:hypothetical protein
MKKFLLLFIFLFNLGFGQEEYLANLPIRGGVSEIGISPSERLWIATKPGNTYYADSIQGLWRFGPLRPKGFISGGIYERVNFFSEDTLMISGYIHGEESDTDFVLWSGNRGKTWEEIKFGKDSWIDAAYINDNGKAWMSGSSQLIYYTEDSGRTWQEFDKIEKKKSVLRFSTIHFSKDESLGLFGSFWNKIYKTRDNCKTWERVPTPLDQKKYERLSKKHRPDIRKIRAFGNYYLINQQGNVYWSEIDSVDWKELPQIRDFEVSENESVYLLDKNLKVELRDFKFQVVFKSEDSLGTYPRAISVRNNNFFALTGNKIYKINQSDFKESKLLTEEIPIPKPQIRLMYGNEPYGFEGNTIFKFDKKKNSWYRFMELEFFISNAVLRDDQIIVADHTLKNRYVLNTIEKKIEKYDLPESLFDLSNNPVKHISFSVGSYGCFHSNSEIREYRLKNQSFVLKRNEGKTFSDMPNEIGVNKINELLKEIDASRYRRNKVADLEVEASDLENFKKFITKSEKRIAKKGIDSFSNLGAYSFPGENTDFEFYRQIADNFDSISDTVLDKVFAQGSSIWSTTTNWRKATLEFKNGRILTIDNSSFKPNYLNTPWTINNDGLLLTSNSIELAKKIDELTKGGMFDGVTTEKNYAIFQIADYLYRETLVKSK